jgi:hypothetical protein
MSSGVCKPGPLNLPLHSGGAREDPAAGAQLRRSHVRLTPTLSLAGIWRATAIARDFNDEQVEAVASLVARASDSERVRAAIVLAAKGDLAEIRSGADLAAVDWRDVLVSGGHADDNWRQRLDRDLGPEAP